MASFAIDLPNPADAEGEWVNYGTYESREEALAAARHHFGADDQGQISLLTEVPIDDVP